MEQVESLLLGDTLYNVLAYGRDTVLELGKVSEYLGNQKRWVRSHMGGHADGVVVSAHKLS
jgi:hypothetical protein